MKISLSWLQDFITLTEHDPQKIADRVTEGMGEVDEVVAQGELLDHCCVGKVLSLKKHPNADKLTLCDVQTDKGVKKIVCGGTNLREGMKVAVAHVGATVRWHGQEMMTLVKTKIRGEESEGMICAAEELDLVDLFPEATDHSIIDLGDDETKNQKQTTRNFPVGISLKEALGLHDTVLHIDNHAITQRPDLFSHVGVAREFVALGLAKWKDAFKISDVKFTKEPIPITFKNEIPDLVPRYAAVMIEIDALGETPRWMKERLAVAGYRSVSLPVDITNYVSAELGMPLHSFDADDLKGTVKMRLSSKGEKITTLDKKELTLPDRAIVLSDDVGIFDLLGIMGGLRSSTKSTTKRMYLHAACVDPVSIRRAIIATAHRTDAATIYEKGIPKSIVEPGLLRAAELMLELIPGARITSKLETWGDDGKPRSIDISVERIRQSLGVDISEKEIIKIFEDLEFIVEDLKPRKKDLGKKKTLSPKSQSPSPILKVTPPLHRLGDIKGPHDLVEEIGRIYGYNKIAPAMPSADITPPPRDHRMKHLRNALKENRFMEILPLSLTGSSNLKRANFDASEAVKIANALSEELSLLHTSTLPGLLEHLERNYLQGRDTFRTFHWGKVFSKGKEHLELSLLLTDVQTLRKEDELLHDSVFLKLKEVLVHALGTIGYAVTVDQMTVGPQAHPGRSGSLTVHGKVIGAIYELHPEIRARLDVHPAIAKRIAIATVHLEDLLAIKPVLKTAKPLPVFPEIFFDENVELQPGEALGPLMQKMKSASALLESIEVVDLYRGAQHKPGASRVTVRCTYRANDKTLTEAEAKTEHQKVLSKR